MPSGPNYVHPYKRRHESEMDFRSLSNLKYNDPVELETKIKQYFDQCDSRGAPYTLPGLALHLGFKSSATIKDYCGRSDELGEIVNRARLAIEASRNEQLLTDDGVPASAKAFDLKVQHRWQEPPQRQEIDNPDGNLGTKVAAFIPEQPKSIDEWKKLYDKEMAQRQSTPAVEEGSGESEG